MRILFALAVAAAVAPVAQAQSTAAPASATLTLDDAITLARRNNPVYLSQANARRTADAAIRSARGGLLPSADASFSSRYQQAGQQVFSGQSFSNSSATLQSGYNLGVNYRVNRSTFLLPKAAMANRDAVEADVAGSAELLRATVTQQYLSVLQAQARAALQDTLVKTAQTQLDLANAKVAVGSGTSLDIRRAEVALGQTQVALSQAYPGFGYAFSLVETPPARIAGFYAAVSAITADLRARPISDDELARARNPRIAGLRKAQLTNEYWLADLSGAMADPRRLDLIRSTFGDYEKVTPADIQAAARAWLTDDRAWKLVIKAADEPGR